MRKRNTYRFGLLAETTAKLFLRCKGYAIVETRHRNAAGEIDIIAKRRKTVVFVEVKARKRKATLVDALSPRQCERITRAASLYMARLPSTYSARFDVVLITPFAWPQHIPHAW